MFTTERLLLRIFDPEVDGNIWVQWQNSELTGPQPWSREKAMQTLENRAKDKNALPWFMICEKPANESELPSALGLNDDYFRTADGKSRYPAVGIINLEKLGGAADTSRTVAFGITLDPRHQGHRPLLLR